MGDDVTGKPHTFLQSIGRRYAAEKLRAQERLKTYGRDEWNFAIVGLDCRLTVIDLEGLATPAKSSSLQEKSFSLVLLKTQPLSEL